MAKKKLVLEKYTTVCIRCQSPDVYIDKTNPAQPYLGLPPLYICNSCNCTGYNFPEIKISDLDKLIKDIKLVKFQEVPTLDTNYGVFTIDVIWKFMGPLTIAFGLMSIYKSMPLDFSVQAVGIFTLLVGFIATYYSYKGVFKSLKKVPN